MSSDFFEVQNPVDKFMNNNACGINEGTEGLFIALVFGLMAAFIIPYLMLETVAGRVALGVAELIFMVVLGEVYYYLNLKEAAKEGITEVSMGDVFITKLGGSFIMLFFCSVWVLITFFVLILVGSALALIGGLLYGLWLLFSTCGAKILITIGSISFIVGATLVHTWINKKFGEKMLKDHAKNKEDK